MAPGLEVPRQCFPAKRFGVGPRPRRPAVVDPVSLFRGDRVPGSNRDVALASSAIASAKTVPRRHHLGARIASDELLPDKETTRSSATSVDVGSPRWVQGGDPRVPLCGDFARGSRRIRAPSKYRAFIVAEEISLTRGGARYRCEVSPPCRVRGDDARDRRASPSSTNARIERWGCVLAVLALNTGRAAPRSRGEDEPLGAALVCLASYPMSCPPRLFTQPRDSHGDLAQACAACRARSPRAGEPARL